MGNESLRGPGEDLTRATIESAIGRTVASVSLQRDPPGHIDEHDGEKVEIRFTDGSVLLLQLGSNVGSLLGRADVRPGDVDLTFIASFWEAAK